MLPALAARQRAGCERGQESRSQQRRLSAARSPDDREQRGVGKSRHELADETLATEEELGVGRLERRQPLERADEARRVVARPPRRRFAVEKGVEGRILYEDGSLELLQRNARLEAQLDVQVLARLPVHRQSFGLPAAAVEREHQLRAQAFTQRLLRDRCLELAHQRRVPAERQLGVDALFHGGEAKLLEPLHLDARERLELEIGEGPAAPQRLRLAKQRGGACRVSLRERRASCGDLLLEEIEIELARFDAQEIAGSAGREPRLLDAVRGESLAQPPDLHSKNMVGLGARLALQLRDQPIARDHTVGAEQQQREQSALLRTADAHGDAVEANIQRAEDQELQAAAGHPPSLPYAVGHCHRARRRCDFLVTSPRDAAWRCSTPPNATGPALRHTSSRKPPSARSKRIYRRARSHATYLGSVLFPGDDLVLCLFEADSRAAVKRASDEAGIPCERVMDTLWIPPNGRSDVQTALRNTRGK